MPAPEQDHVGIVDPGRRNGLTAQRRSRRWPRPVRRARQNGARRWPEQVRRSLSLSRLRQETHAPPAAFPEIDLASVPGRQKPNRCRTAFPPPPGQAAEEPAAGKIRVLFASCVAAAGWTWIRCCRFPTFYGICRTKYYPFCRSTDRRRIQDRDPGSICCLDETPLFHHRIRRRHLAAERGIEFFGIG